MKRSVVVLVIGIVLGVLLWGNVQRLMQGRTPAFAPGEDVLPPTSSVSSPADSPGNLTRSAAATLEKVVVNIDIKGRAVSIPEWGAFGLGSRYVYPQGAGSGVIIRADGFIVTNNHVVADAQTIDVTLSTGERVRGELWGRDPNFDLAVVKIPRTGLPYARLGDSDKISVGDSVIAVGNALGLGTTVTSGIVSARERDVQGPAQGGSMGLEKAIQTDAAINRGNSGGALALLNGQLIGINTAILSTGQGGGSIGIGFAIPSNTVRKVASELIRFRKFEPAWVGVEYAPNGPDVAARIKQRFGLDYPNSADGIIVGGIVPGGPASEAGIKPLDNILKVDGAAVNGTRGFASAIHGRKPGETVKIELWRPSAKKKVTVPVRLGAMPPQQPQSPTAGPHSPF